jgi:4-diphosphocytidyl-2C-methyl-D-erythritol kinase
MSGSGSAIFGIFRQKTLGIEEEFPRAYVAVKVLD